MTGGDHEPRPLMAVAPLSLAPNFVGRVTALRVARFLVVVVRDARVVGPVVGELERGADRMARALKEACVRKPRSRCKSKRR